MTAPYPEKDINLLTPNNGPYNPNDFPQPGQTTPPQTIDPNFTYPEVDTALLPGVPGQRGATGPAGPTGATGPAGVTPVFVMQDSLVVRAGVNRFYFESTRTITKIRASVSTPSVGAPVVVALLINGVTVGTVSVAAGAYTATTTLSQVVNLNDYATVNVTGVGSTTAGSDLTVTLTIN
jgi:hypothetical protein